VHDNEGQFPWLAGGDADYRLADEVAACAVERGGVDPTRIHSLGFSAGALFTARLAFARARYIASVVTYSGGLLENAPPPPSQNPRNKFAALALSGGPRDNVFNTDFDVASRALQAKLTGDGHFALYCDHGGGHRIPTDYRRAAGKFLVDHPFGTTPSPYEGALPSELKACSAAP
jgi:predicted esterase